MRITFFSMFLLLCLELNSQTIYNFGQIPFNPDPLQGTTTYVPNANFWIPAALPFSFCFLDSVYDSVLIGPHACLKFIDNPFQYAATHACSVVSHIPGYLNSSNNEILFGHRQLFHNNVSGEGFIRTQTYGTAPNRRFVISYDSLVATTGTCFMHVKLQIKLFEQSNQFEVHFIDNPNCPVFPETQILGIQKDSVTAWFVPGRSSFGDPAWSAQNEAWLVAPTGSCGVSGGSCHLNGKVFLDENSDCIHDSAEAPVRGRCIVVDGGNSYGWTDSLGIYSIPVDTGTHLVEEWFPPGNIPYLQGCFPPNHQYSAHLAQSGAMANNLDFGDMGLSCPDLSVNLLGTRLRRCMNTNLSIFYGNVGTIADSNVSITLTLVDSVQIQYSSVPYTPLGNNQYSFLIGTLQAYQQGSILLTIHTGCDSLGTVHVLSAMITGQAGPKCDPDNSFQNAYTVVGSFDPNVKLVAAINFAQEGWKNYEEISNSTVLTYQVHFQNTGTDTAFNVRVWDSLPAGLDENSLQVLGASHNFNWAIINHVLILDFSNILLVDSLTNEPLSHGYFTYRISQQSGNAPGTSIHNTAAIYFDGNAAVITPPATVHIPASLSMEDRMVQEIKLFPNPGRDVLKIETSKEGSLAILDLSGKRVLEFQFHSGMNQFSTRELPEGVYLICISDSLGNVITRKWMKLK